MTKEDKNTAESAEREAEAQLAILRALKQLKRVDRARVLKAVAFLLDADDLVPGVFEAVGRGLRDASRP